MKTKSYFLFTALSLFTAKVFAQSNEDVVNILQKKGLLTQREADSLRSDYSVKQEQNKKNQTLFPIQAGRGVQISGYSQVRFQSLQEADKPDGFDIRRARLDIRGSINKVWEYRLMTDFASSPKLIDAFVSFKPYDFLKITAGQFYVPFSLENLTPDRQLEFIDRSQVVNALVSRDKDVIGNNNGRDIGIQVSGNVWKRNDRFIFDYYLGAFNGQGINVVDLNESKDIAGRLVAHPFHFFDIGASYYNGYDAWGSPSKNQRRVRSGAEVAFHYHSWSVKAEYILGQDGKTKINGKTEDLVRAGWYTQATWFIFPKQLQVVLRYDTYDPNTFKAPESQPQNDITSWYTGGLNYFINEWAKVQVSYSLRKEQGPQINNDVISAQFQVSF
ncbi:MAG TPA: porin [Bacteroidia bacterium]|jgi:phosphate-selective porin